MITVTTAELDHRKGTIFGQDVAKHNMKLNAVTGITFLSGRYAKMSSALLKAGRPILYSICEW